MIFGTIKIAPPIAATVIQLALSQSATPCGGGSGGVSRIREIPCGLLFLLRLVDNRAAILLREDLRPRLLLEHVVFLLHQVELRGDVTQDDRDGRGDGDRESEP